MCATLRTRNSRDSQHLKKDMASCMTMGRECTIAFRLKQMSPPSRIWVSVPAVASSAALGKLLPSTIYPPELNESDRS